MIEKAKWIQDCKLCNDGIVIAVKERIAQGNSERASCKELSEISQKVYPELADEFSFDAIYGRWLRHGKGYDSNKFRKGAVLHSTPTASAKPRIERESKTQENISEEDISDLELKYFMKLKDAEIDYENVRGLISYFHKMNQKEKEHIFSCKLCNMHLIKSVNERIAKGMNKQDAFKDIAENFADNYHEYPESVKEAIQSLIRKRYEFTQEDNDFKLI